MLNAITFIFKRNILEGYRTGIKPSCLITPFCPVTAINLIFENINLPNLVRQMNETETNPQRKNDISLAIFVT